MKSPLLKLALAGAVILGASASTLRADDWKTNDGKVYQDVKVIRSEPDAVTILHRYGGGRISLADLPGDLQKRFNYDPVKAKAAADERARDDAENARALQAEMNEASDMRQAGAEPDADTNACSTRDAGSSTDGPAPADATHHTMDELTGSASAMRRDLSDPTYHTMAHLAYSIRSLAADPDPNHHTIDELSNLGL